MLAVPPGILETWVGRAGFATGVVGMTGDAGVGGLMDDQPELAGGGFALRHNLISRVGLTRTQNKNGRV